MEAGSLRQRVTIEEPNQDVQNDFGEVVPAPWSAVATIWGAVEPLSGRERWVGESDQRLATATVRIRIRYRQGITPQMRVAHVDNAGQTRYYRILEVRNLEMRDREIHLMCEELPGGQS